MNLRKIFAVILALMLTLSVFAACGDADNNPDVTEPVQTGDAQPEDNSGAPDEAETPAEAGAMKIASLKGPTTIGMVKLMDDSDNGLTSNSYDVQIFGTADEIVGLLVNGDIDAANIPCNLASVLYKKTEKGIKVVGINTLGVLYVLSASDPESAVNTEDPLETVADLKGKTIYSTGKGTTPEYVLNYILTQNGIDPVNDVNIEYLSEATEVAAKMSESADAIAVLPQPYVTVAMTQNENLRIVFDLTEEWNKIDGSQLVTGVTVVRSDFLEQNPETVARFMSDYAASVEYVNANVDDAAALVEKYDIVKAPVAKKAIPYCNIVFMTGEDMKTNVENYLTVLYNSDPTSVGGELPDESFYHTES